METEGVTNHTIFDVEIEKWRQRCHFNGFPVIVYRFFRNLKAYNTQICFFLPNSLFFRPPYPIPEKNYTFFHISTENSKKLIGNTSWREFEFFLIINMASITIYNFIFLCNPKLKCLLVTA